MSGAGDRRRKSHKRVLFSGLLGLILGGLALWEYHIAPQLYEGEDLDPDIDRGFIASDGERRSSISNAGRREGVGGRFSLIDKAFKNAAFDYQGRKRLPNLGTGIGPRGGEGESGDDAYDPRDNYLNDADASTDGERSGPVKTNSLSAKPIETGWTMNQALEKQEYIVTINVLANNRLESLQRLIDSLMAAEYFGEVVPLDFHLEAGQNQEMIDYVQSVNWKYGPKGVHPRLSKGGLINVVVESWFPASDNEYGILLEDDIQVSPYFFKWARMAIDAARRKEIYKDENGADHVIEKSRVVGVSLYTPRINELVRPKTRFNATEVVSNLGHAPLTPFLQQLPCSWGAVYFPRFWREFQRYMAFRIGPDQLSKRVDVPGSVSVGWTASWKKYFIELAWARGYFVLYPNFLNETSLSTNHLEPGEHIKTGDTDHLPEHYTVPLMEEDLLSTTFPDGQIPDLSTLPHLDVFGHSYLDMAAISRVEREYGKEARISAPRVKFSDTRDRECHIFNVPASVYLTSQPSSAEQFTLLISHFYSPARFPILMEQIQYYSRSPSINRILILWHDPTLRPPRKMRLPSPILSDGGTSSGDTLVDFLWQKSNSLNNRFRPNLLITTPSVLIMDDDMQVHLEDLDLLHAVWTRYPERIAGFFPRWHDVGKDSKNNPFLKYVTSDTGNTQGGYSLMLTKCMMIATHYLYDYTCGGGHIAHDLVDTYLNAEDISMNILVINRTHGAPSSILVNPTMPLADYGTHNKKGGLHNRVQNFQQARSLILTEVTSKLVKKPGGKLDIPLERATIEVVELEGREMRDAVQSKHWKRRRRLALRAYAGHIDVAQIPCKYTDNCGWNDDDFQNYTRYVYV